jgi:hypothetical protein
MFVIGTGNISETVLKEHAMYKDLYFVDCPDGYFDLSSKACASKT